MMKIFFTIVDAKKGQNEKARAMYKSVVWNTTMEVGAAPAVEKSSVSRFVRPKRRMRKLILGRRRHVFLVLRPLKNSNNINDPNDEDPIDGSSSSMESSFSQMHRG